LPGTTVAQQRVTTSMMGILMKAFSTCFTRMAPRVAAGQPVVFFMENRHNLKHEDQGMMINIKVSA
jgi:FtsP/CotA-like multicopper oxidase with cupredoxin domain